MPGMSMTPASGPAWLVLAEIALFWSAMVVHLLRLFAGGWLPDPDPAADLGHAAMAGGMVYMVFPDASAAIGRLLAFGFAGLGVWFAHQAVRGTRPHPGQYTAIAVGQGTTAVMLGVGHPPGAVAAVLAAALVACAAVHGRRWSTTHLRRAPHARAHRGDQHVFVTLPHLGAVATTLAMAAMIAAG